MQLYLLDGARLRELREEAGLSQEDLSSMVGQRKGWIRELEQQSRVHVLELFMQRLVDALGVGISDMTTFPDPPPPPPPPHRREPGAGHHLPLRGARRGRSAAPA